MEVLGLNLECPQPKLIFRTKSNLMSSTEVKTCEKDANTPVRTKINIEYLLILIPYLKHYNSSCGLCICTRYFGQNKEKPTSLLVRCVLKCNGRKCPFQCVVHVLNSGSCTVLSSNPNILHVITERISRPIRGSKRREIMQKFEAGGSVYRVHAQYDQKRTIKEKKAFNHDATGKSKAIFKKIKAETVASTLLDRDAEKGILKLYDQLAAQVNSDGVIKGVLQEVQLRPFCVISFLEASIRLYDALVADPNTVLSWDATGGIIKHKQSAKQILYYELTLACPGIVKEDTLIPLTYMLSESHSLFTVVQWLTLFKESYKKVFPHKRNNFARPAIILSDRAQVFLQAALRVFNEETYDQFLLRAYRIVTNQASNGDLAKTNIHACLAHFMLDMRKLVNRCLGEEMRELGMWSMALLINTSTWKEMLSNWRLICLVFWNYGNDDDGTSRNYSNLLLKIQSISSDPNSNQAISASKSIVTDVSDVFAFDKEDECQAIGVTGIVSRMRKKPTISKNNREVFDEEREFNQADSPFRQELQDIFDECCRMDKKRNTSSSVNVRANKEARDWLTYIMRHHLPTVPIWSNLLLRRYPQQVIRTVKSFDEHLLKSNPQRTNAISERRMCIVKRTQLGTQTYARPDTVLRILSEDLQRMTESFSVSFMAREVEKNSSSQRRRLKEISEHWNKSNRRGYGRYTKEPPPTIMNSLSNSLIAPSLDINDNLLIPNLSAPTWLNVAIGLILSIRTVRQSPPRSTNMKTPLLIDVANFIESWCIHLEKTRLNNKQTRTKTSLLNTKFMIPANISNDAFEQSIFLLHNILLPVIAKPTEAITTHHCIACKSAISKRTFIDHISINNIDGQPLLRNELSNYFNSSTSDILCSRCSKPMNRRIQLLDCPTVIVINVNDVGTTSVTPRKPPSTLSLANALHPLSMASPVTTNFDIVGFLSIVPTNGSEKLMLATRIKQRWFINSTQKLVGENESLCQMYSRSRIIILERLHKSNADFLRALLRCCCICDIDLRDIIGTYETLRDAVKEIENNPNLARVRQTISPSYTDYFRCPSCPRTSDLLALQHDCVSVYQQSPEVSIPIAMPLLWHAPTWNKECPNCLTKFGDMIPGSNKQTHQQCSNILLFRIQTTSFQKISKFRLSLLNSETNTVCQYTSLSALLVDQYNCISIIQLVTPDCWTVYCQPPYSAPVIMSEDEMDDLFVTAESVILFLKRVENINEHDFQSSSHVSPSRRIDRTSVIDQAPKMPKFFTSKKNQQQTRPARGDPTISSPR